MDFEGRFVAPGHGAGQGGLGPAAEGLLQSRPQKRREGFEGVSRREPGSGHRIPRSRDESRQAIGAERRCEVVQRTIPGLDGHGSASEGDGQILGCGPAGPRSVDGEGDSLKPPCVARRTGERLEGVAGTRRQPLVGQRGEELGSV